MPTITHEQTVRRNASDVFRVITHLETYPEWNPTVQRARKLGPGPPAEGATYEFWIKGFGRTEQTLREFQPDARVRLVPSSPKYTGGHRFELRAEAGGTRIQHTLELQPRGMLRLMTPFMKTIMRKNLRATADALQRHLEKRPG
jgi:hypothetical protein